MLCKKFLHAARKRHTRTQQLTKYKAFGARCGCVKLSPPATEKSGCGDGYTCWILISTLHNHSIYQQWDTERVKLEWIAWISPKSLNLGVKSGIQVTPILTPLMTQKHVVVTIWEFRYQSQPSWTIQYTDDETLGGLRCNEILRSIQTYSILVWNVGGPGAEIVTTRDWKVRVWWWLCMLNINLNLAQNHSLY